MAGLYQKKYIPPGGVAKIKVTGGVSRIGYLLTSTGYLKGEGGIVIQTTKTGIDCATQCVCSAPPLVVFLGWWGVVVGLILTMLALTPYLIILHETLYILHHNIYNENMPTRKLSF